MRMIPSVGWKVAYELRACDGGRLDGLRIPKSHEVCGRSLALGGWWPMGFGSCSIWTIVSAGGWWPMSF
jgi:hypothetical protein